MVLPAQGARNVLKGFLIACVLALAVGAAAGFAMPADAAGMGASTLYISP
jgi:hypothetical protein